MINEEDKFAGLPEHLQSYGGEIRIAKGGIFEAKEFVCYPEDEIKVIAEGIVESDSTTCKSLRDFVSNIDGFTSLPIKENLKGKTIEIIIREVTDE